MIISVAENDQTPKISPMKLTISENSLHLVNENEKMNANTIISYNQGLKSFN
jgi:hypothetical protein